MKIVPMSKTVPASSESGMLGNLRGEQREKVLPVAQTALGYFIKMMTNNYPFCGKLRGSAGYRKSATFATPVQTLLVRVADLEFRFKVISRLKEVRGQPSMLALDTHRAHF